MGADTRFKCADVGKNRVFLGDMDRMKTVKSTVDMKLIYHDKVTRNKIH